MTNPTLQGIRARYDNDVFQAYQCFLEGGQQQLAHTIALNELAPEVVIRGDTEVLKSLFGNFTPSDISGWHDTGNVRSHLSAARRGV